MKIKVYEFDFVLNRMKMHKIKFGSISNIYVGRPGFMFVVLKNNKTLSCCKSNWIMLQWRIYKLLNKGGKNEK